MRGTVPSDCEVWPNNGEVTSELHGNGNLLWSSAVLLIASANCRLTNLSFLRRKRKHTGSLNRGSRGRGEIQE